MYRYHLDRFLLPALASRPLARIRTEDVRALRNRVARASSPTQAAKAYRLLRVILATAVEDDRIASNPGKIRGAGVERSAERPFIDIDLVLALARNIEPRYAALVLLAGFGGLRLGELLALRRCDLALADRLVTVTSQTVELRNGERLTTAPKTDAGRRTVELPATVARALAAHLDHYCGPEPEALVFTGPRFEGLRRATFYKEWDKARAATGLGAVHLHDLRHAAGTLAAQTGATTRELMARLGHASPAAAHRYQHAATRRDAVIAMALEEFLRRFEAENQAASNTCVGGLHGG